jgi:hypothetical protein
VPAVLIGQPVVAGGIGGGHGDDPSSRMATRCSAAVEGSSRPGDRFHSSSHGSEFSDEQSLQATVDELKAWKGLAAKNIAPIRVFALGGVLYTLDHRRLVAHQQARVPSQTALATPREVASEWGKAAGLKAGDDGIKIRQRPPRVRGK